MEPPPRLYTYGGLFTESRSLDLTLRIVSTTLSFTFFLIFLAWRISRRHYTNPPAGVGLNFESFSDLCRNGVSRLTSSFVYRKPKFPIVRGYLNHQKVLFVEDWKVITLYSHFTLLDIHYSLAPRSFRRKWYGLMIADDTLQFRSELHELVILAFSALPMRMFERVGQLGADPKAFGGILIDNGVPFDIRLDKWICSMHTELFFFGSREVFYEFTPENMSALQKEKFVLQLREHITSLELLHTHGYCSETSNLLKSFLPFMNFSKSCNNNNLISAFYNLINPLIHYYLEKYLSSEEYTKNSTSHHLDQAIDNHNGDSECLRESKKSTNLLLQLIISYHYLKEEGSSNEFLTLTHIIHLLVECCLVTRQTLNKNLKVLLKVLALKPEWQDNLRKECKQFLENYYNRTNPMSPSPTHCPSHLCFSLKHTKCLVFTKALIQETLRLCALGWPFGCLRQAFRDGQIVGQDFSEGELVLFDEPAYYSDPDLWDTDLPNNENKRIGIENQAYKTFDPQRFIEKFPGEENSTKLELTLPVHWARNILQGYTVCVPHQFTYLVLTTTLVHLFGTAWESYITDEKIEPVYTDETLQWSDDLPAVDLKINFS
uniref:Cytochrome P450 n=1 Tax=Trichobilharzia regenti TaxID=157069 RepID=A0AA85KJA5_TRIRE|nr:unnamed protein product [Trichobilharzia regenti]